MVKRRHEDTREHLLATGESIILGKGFSAVGIAEVLSAADVPKGSFYHYFASKEAFGAALLERYFTEYLGHVNALFNEPGTGAEKLMRYWTGWLTTYSLCRCEEQCLVVKLSAEVSDLSEAMRAELKLGTDRVISQLTRVMESGIADGSLPALDPAHTAQVLYQLWLGASLLTKVRLDNSALEAALSATRSMLKQP
ncbi:TetR/AcrR family transcriptional regulator [Andreprevotia chitinilytica]|uniref:TetR/AcrR family transcriptional regulator n=1 Tax=Andreprevotia chitinilytica TaxID=396808 RepID=UPI00054DAA4B|nr:TetR/AcrR family transcriptional regulator [Andreprevotia chitinilytica]